SSSPADCRALWMGVVVLLPLRFRLRQGFGATGRRDPPSARSRRDGIIKFTKRTQTRYQDWPENIRFCRGTRWVCLEKRTQTAGIRRPDVALRFTRSQGIDFCRFWRVFETF